MEYSLSFNSKFCLSDEKVQELRKTDLVIPDFWEISGNRCEYTFHHPVIAEQLFEIIPWETYVDEECCFLNISNDIIDNECVYVASYYSKQSGEPYISFSGESLVDALYEALMWCHENNRIDEQYYDHWVEKVGQEMEQAIEDAFREAREEVDNNIYTFEGNNSSFVSCSESAGPSDVTYSHPDVIEFYTNQTIKS
jgi:hypothetical protein